jgi:hypothetical protein
MELTFASPILSKVNVLRGGDRHAEIEAMYPGARFLDDGGEKGRLAAISLSSYIDSLLSVVDIMVTSIFLDPFRFDGVCCEPNDGE